MIDGGWLAKNEIPSGKGSYGTFNAVSDENKRILRKILNPQTDSSSLATDRYDEETLTKLRDLYSSCMDEDLLNERGDTPLRDIVRTIRDLYRSDNWKKLKSDEAEKEENPLYGLTAATSFLHSRGIGGLFNFDIDGDVGVDPNFMTLWFFQPDLGLPSKVPFLLLVASSGRSRLFSGILRRESDHEVVQRHIGSHATRT